MCLYLDNLDNKLLVELDKRFFIGKYVNTKGVCNNCKDCEEYLIIRKFK